MQFAKDTILFLENDKDSFLNTFSLLKVFELSSLLTNDMSKSGLRRLAGINVDFQTISSIASLIGCQIWPLVYLGVPLGGNPRAIHFRIQLLRRFLSTLTHGKDLIPLKEPDYSCPSLSIHHSSLLPIFISYPNVSC